MRPANTLLLLGASVSGFALRRRAAVAGAAGGLAAVGLSRTTPPRAMVVVGDGGNDNRGAEEVHNSPALRLGLAIPQRIVSRTGAAAAAAL